MDRNEEAVKLFMKSYGITPQEAGFPEIDIYEKQHAFLYAKYEAVINAYKMQQNILRWVMCWFTWPIAVAFLIWLITLGKSQDAGHPLCIVCYIFYVVWVALLIVLGISVKRADKIVKVGKTITFLNY